jgi:hypothetical protein
MNRNSHRGAVARRLVPSLLAAGLVAAFAFASTAHAARPLVTDDAAIVDRGALELSLWCERASGARLCPISGAFTPFGATEWTVAAGRLGGELRGSLASVGVKQLLAGGGDDGPAFALGAAWTRLAPRGEPSNRELDLVGIVTVPTPVDGTVMHVNLGGRVVREDGERARRGLWALALDRDFDGRAGLAAEVFGVAGDERRWQLSARWLPVGDRLQLDLSHGQALGRGPSDRLVTAGLVLFFGS